MLMRGFRGMLLCAAILSLWAAPAHAQAGSIFGRVTDASGGVLPGATVTVTGSGLQQPLVATSSENGTYQIVSVPVGTYSVAFELASFKKALRQNVVITINFSAQIDQKLEIGQMSEEVNISAASPVVDTKKTTTGAIFTAEILEKIPTAHDPWQIINMTPGVQAGLNVGGSTSGQQVSLASRGTQANVQWNLEGGSVTDLSSNSSANYFNFDSFDQIQVTTGGGDVSVQSSGLSINLVTKSGSNVFKGSANMTFENDKTQGNNVTQALFNLGGNGFLSGQPVQKIGVYDVEYGGPVRKNRLWFWGATDKQDINIGTLNFFDPTKGSFCQGLVDAQKSKSPLGITYANLSQVQNCLNDDKYAIKDIQWKINYQISASHKIQWSFISDNKYRNHRGATATTAAENSTQQTSDAPWKLPLPIHQFTHTWIVSDKLVINNMLTTVYGGFFLDYQDVPPQGGCPQSRYLGADNQAAYEISSRANGGCLWNTQELFNRTTSLDSRALGASYQTVRHGTEIKSDGTYFLTHVLGGDHSLKFGVGYRKNPVLTFQHYSGSGEAEVQCVGNTLAGCGDGSFVPVGSAAGFVPYIAFTERDRLSSNDNWWTYNGYIQDGFSRGKVRMNGGLRYDWQTSSFLGGCVGENAIVPTLLPAQCDKATNTDGKTGKKLSPFSNLSPRVSFTYDLFGDGKTQVHASGSYYYDTRLSIANSLGGLGQIFLQWGPNQSSGACSATAGSNCWTDANHDGLVQANELIGNGTPSNSTRFVNGVLVPTGNIVDPSAKIGRTREGIVGMQHELIPNLAVSVDFIYRKYDRGTSTYTVGYQPGGPLFPLSALYTGPFAYTDPATSLTGYYYQICDGCARPSGLASITTTNLEYQIYKGVDITATKRYSNRWQMATALTIQTNPGYFPTGSNTFINPTNRQFRDGVSTIAKYVFKAQGAYTFPWDITGSANLNFYQGATRTLTTNGPGAVYGGTTGTISYSTLEYQPRDAFRFKPTKLLDLSAQKAVRFRGGKDRVKVTLDAFNVFNVNAIQSYVSGLTTNAGFTQPSTIIPPRIFRVGLSVNF